MGSFGVGCNAAEYAQFVKTAAGFEATLDQQHALASDAGQSLLWLVGAMTQVADAARAGVEALSGAEDRGPGCGMACRGQLLRAEPSAVRRNRTRLRVQMRVRRIPQPRKKAPIHAQNQGQMRLGTAYRIPSETSHASHPRSPSTSRRRMRHMRQDP